MGFLFKDLNDRFCTCEVPNPIKYFSRLAYAETLPICQNNPPITNITNASIQGSIESIKLINTPIALSFEGQNLTGYKLLVDVSLSGRIVYTTTTTCGTDLSTVLNFNDLKSVYVVLPAVYNGRKICDLLRNNRLIVNPIIEDSSFRIKNDCNIYIYSSLIINVEIY